METSRTIEEKKVASEWTVEKLRALTLDEVMKLFKTLDAPPFTEMDGEYEAGLLDHGSAWNNFTANWSINSKLLNGKWLCKAFTPTSNTEGHGYNSFNKNDKVLRKYRMKTSIAQSRYDGKPIFQLYYPAYKHMLASINMVDEVRKIHDGLYLGIGTAGMTKKARMRPMPFTLSGPIADFVGPDKEELK